MLPRFSIRSSVCCFSRVAWGHGRAGRLLGARSALAALALGALAFGGGCDDDDEVRPLEPVTGAAGSGGFAGTSAGGASAGGAAEAGAAGASVSEPGPDAGADASTEPPEGGDDEAGALERDVLATSALGILARDCGACHSGSERAGGLGDFDDLDALVSSGVIIPGASERSPVLDSIRAGRMPPADSRTRPSVGEQWLLEGFIDGLFEPEGCDPHPLPSVDEAYAAMLADALAQPDADRPFIRYVNLMDTGAGACRAALQERRGALFEAVNGTSLDPEIHVPVPIDAYELLYRVDIRHYDWDRAMDLDADGSDDHADGWLALVAAAGRYAAELQGPEADALRAATATPVPVLPGGALVWAATSGDTYYTLIGARANIFDTQLALGIDEYANLENLVSRVAAFESNVLYRKEVLVARQPQSAFGRGYWSLSQQRDCDAETIYDTGLDDEREAGQAIWHLPNGLLAYSVEERDGNRLTSPPDSSTCPECCGSTSALYPVGGNPAGCHACHHRGLAPVRDEVLSVLLQNIRAVPLPPEELAVIFSAADLDALMAADNAIYLDALARTRLTPTQRSPLSSVYLSFERAPIHLERAAAELGSTPAALLESLARLPAGFAPLADRGGSISRAAMTEGQSAARCVLSEGARNRPVECPSGS